MRDQTASIEALQRDLKETREALNRAREEIRELQAMLGRANLGHAGIVLEGHADRVVQALDSARRR